MARVNYFLLCENFTRDNRNRVSIINAFDVVGGEKLPIVPLKFVVAFSITVHRDDIKKNLVKLKIAVSEKEGKEILKLEGNARIKVAEGTVASSVDLGSRLLLKRDVLHEVALYLNGKKIETTTFNVVKGVTEDEY